MYEYFKIKSVKRNFLAIPSARQAACPLSEVSPQVCFSNTAAVNNFVNTSCLMCAGIKSLVS